jgi:myo-inositol-1(or 4)-monophosphatase
MADILTIASAAAKQAGDFLLQNFGHVTSMAQKADHSFVTNVDKEAETMIINQITSAFPDHGILSEEAGPKNLDADYLWVIDPLDGTHNFIRNIPIFGVSIGVVYKKEIIAGVIYMPVHNEFYSAEKGSGAFKNNGAISVSSIADLHNVSLHYDSTFKNNPSVAVATLASVSAATFNCRMYGSSVRSLTYLAEGTLDAIIEFDDNPWDYTAGICLVREAGGTVTHLKTGKDFCFGEQGYLATNSQVHSGIWEIVRSKKQ